MGRLLLTKHIIKILRSKLPKEGLHERIIRDIPDSKELDECGSSPPAVWHLFDWTTIISEILSGTFLDWTTIISEILSGTFFDWTTIILEILSCTFFSGLHPLEIHLRTLHHM